MCRTAKAAHLHFRCVAVVSYVPEDIRLSCVAPDIMLTPVIGKIEHNEKKKEKELIG